MAKQSGIHQIRGKVGEYSYYRQSGVKSGLIRGINQGLSSRVKNSDEYANTRLNNAEFGAAASVASVLGKLVYPKFRPMILPFSQSRMAKAIVETAREHSALWGQRVVTDDDTAQLCRILTNQSKSAFSDLFAVEQTTPVDNTMTINFLTTQAIVNDMLGLGIDGFVIYGYSYVVLSGKYSSDTRKIAPAIYSAVDFTSIDLELDSEHVPDAHMDLDLANTPVTTVAYAHHMFVFVFLPYRKVGGSKYTLQEQCRFICTESPSAVL